MRASIAPVVWVVLVVLCGCAAGNSAPFAPGWHNDQGASIARVQKRLESATAVEGPGVAVGVTQTGLVGVDLGSSKTWSHTTRVLDRPVIAGDVVVGTDASDVFALDASTGHPMWKVAHHGFGLRGAGDDGSYTVVTLGAAQGGESLVYVVDRSGTVSVEERTINDVGVPAMLGGVAFVPWSNQYVSAIEASSGLEIGRLLMRRQVSHAAAFGGKLYFGEYELVAFDRSIGQAATGGGTTVTLPKVDLPGKPRWLGSGVESRPVEATAPDKVRLFARPNADGLASGHFSATYFRIVFGFDDALGEMNWVRVMPSDVIAGSAGSSGFVYCDLSGNVWLVDGKSGGDAGKVSLGTPVQSCVVQAGAHRFSAPRGKLGLVSQLQEVLSSRDTQMAAAQQIVLEELGRRAAPETTDVLIQMLSTPHLAPVLIKRARVLLAERRSGADYMTEALELHYDFLEGREASPAVGPMADALAAMKHTAAAPLLVAQLHDPANDLEDVERIARALAVLATEAEYSELARFFAMYRDGAVDDSMVRAVLSVARAMVRVGGESAVELVRKASNAPRTPPPVANGLVTLLPD